MTSIEREYVETRTKSRALYDRAQQSMPSGAAHDGRVFSPFPFYVERADGAYKWDVDGHRYLDCWSGHGALMLGHNHPAVLAACQRGRRASSSRISETAGTGVSATPQESTIFWASSRARATSPRAAARRAMRRCAMLSPPMRPM